MGAQTILSGKTFRSRWSGPVLLFLGFLCVQLSGCAREPERASGFGWASWLDQQAALRDTNFFVVWEAPGSVYRREPTSPGGVWLKASVDTMARPVGDTLMIWSQGHLIRGSDTIVSGQDPFLPFAALAAAPLAHALDSTAELAVVHLDSVPPFLGLLQGPAGNWDSLPLTDWAVGYEAEAVIEKRTGRLMRLRMHRGDLPYRAQAFYAAEAHFTYSGQTSRLPAAAAITYYRRDPGHNPSPALSDGKFFPGMSIQEEAKREIRRKILALEGEARERALAQMAKSLWTPFPGPEARLEAGRWSLETRYEGSGEAR